MDIPKAGSKPDPTREAPDRQGRSSAQGTPPPTRNVIPFSRGNYSYPLRPPEGDESPDASIDDDPGPSAA